MPAFYPLLLLAGLLDEPAPAVPTRLTLREAIERARAASPSIARLRALERGAVADTDLARSSRLPQLELQAGYTRNSEVPELRLAFPGQAPRTIFPNIPDNYRARLALGLPLYTGGRLGGLVDASEHEALASEQDVGVGRADLDLEVSAAYWSLATERERERVLGEALAAFESHLKDAGNRERFGLAARNEVLAVQVERDRAELERLRASNAARVAEANLARLLDLEAAGSFEVAEPLGSAGGSVPEPEALLTEALANRAERAALEARVAAASARARAEQALRQPQLQLGAGYDYASPNRKILPLVSNWNDTWDVSLNLSLNVFDGGRIAAATARVTAQADALRQQLVDLDRRIRLQITRARLDLEAARKGVAVAQSGLLSGRENRRVTAERYKEGVASSSELLDAEVALQRAGLDHTEALAQVRLAEAGLVRALGRSW